MIIIFCYHIKKKTHENAGQRFHVAFYYMRMWVVVYSKNRLSLTYCLLNVHCSLK